MKVRKSPFTHFWGTVVDSLGVAATTRWRRRRWYLVPCLYVNQCVTVPRAYYRTACYEVSWNSSHLVFFAVSSAPSCEILEDRSNRWWDGTVSIFRYGGRRHLRFSIIWNWLENAYSAQNWDFKEIWPHLYQLVACHKGKANFSAYNVWIKFLYLLL